jgi:hypothetical protein
MATKGFAIGSRFIGMPAAETAFNWANNVDLDGSNDFLGSTSYTYQNYSSLDASVMSVSMWFKLDTTGLNNKYLFYITSTSGLFFQSLFVTTGIRFLADPSIAYTHTWTQDTNWHHVAAMRKSGTFTVWFDGTQVYTNTIGAGTIKVSAADLRYSTLGGVNGRMREILMYNREILQADVNKLYNGGDGGSPPSGNLIMRIRPTDSVGTTSGNLTDISGEGNDLPMNNFVAPYGVVANV